MDAEIQLQTEDSTDFKDIQILNRSVVIAHFNENFYSWYSKQSPNPKSEEEVLDTPFTFLIPPAENEEEAEAHFADAFYEIFESLLSEFIESEEVIEASLTEENFNSWIDYNFSNFVYDAATDYELSYESEDTEVVGSLSDGTVII